jgi:hypothetical protein
LTRSVYCLRPVRRLLAVLAFAMPLLEPAQLALRAAGVGEHSCDGHVCLCARRCPPKQAAADDCHGEAPLTGLRGSCHHDQRAELPLLTAGLLPPAPPGAIQWTAIPLLPPPAGAALPGVCRLDLPPPRTA